MYTNTINLWEGREDVTLTSYCMEKNDEIIGCDRRPAVIILPGGGYAGFTEREGEAVALRFMAAGYQSFVLHYSVCEKLHFPGHFMIWHRQCAFFIRMQKGCVSMRKGLLCADFPQAEILLHHLA